MNLSQWTVITSSIHIILSLCFIIPFTINNIISGGGAMGYGLILLPITVPLSFCILIAPIAFFNVQKQYHTLKTWFVTANVTIALSGVIAYGIMPLIPLFLIGVPVNLLLINRMTQHNFTQRLLIANSLILICLVTWVFVMYPT